jgi:hypothetical protein
MKNKFINHARNVKDRAVSLLLRMNQLWYKYIYMEEMLGNIAGAKQVLNSDKVSASLLECKRPLSCACFGGL